jgi:hypothetical protein
VVRLTAKHWIHVCTECRQIRNHKGSVCVCVRAGHEERADELAVDAAALAVLWYLKINLRISESRLHLKAFSGGERSLTRWSAPTARSVLQRGVAMVTQCRGFDTVSWVATSADSVSPKCKLTWNKKFWKELIAYFPLVRQGTHRKRRLQQPFVAAGTSLSSYYLVTTGGYIDRSTVQLLLCVFVPCRCLATTGETHRLMGGLYEVLPWVGIRCHDMYAKFNKDWFRHSKVDMGRYTDSMEVT